MHLRRGTVGEREKGMGRKGGSVYSQPGIRVDGNLRNDTEAGFQVSKRGVQGIRVGISKQKGIIKGWGMHLRTYHANCVYIVLIEYISC
jgi:hypothetical protein